jgi:hypothetical protein
MRPFDRTPLLFCVASLGLQGFAIGASADDEQGTNAPPGYASPLEAFEARRDALAKRDWRKAFASLTPEVQDTEIFYLGLGWLWVEEGMEGGPFDGLGEAERKEGMARLRATMKKYGLDAERLWTEYDKRYLAAHGVDLAKIKVELRRRGRERMERRFKGHPAERAEVEKYIKEHPEVADQFLLPPEPGEAPDPSLPELDDELLENVIPTLVTDRSAFYEAASEIFTPKVKRKSGYDDDFGNLKGLKVSGDTAKGWIVWSRSRMENGTRDVWEPVRVLRKFRRLDGRWYNDYTSDDLTHFDDAEAKGSRSEPRGESGGVERRRP